MIYIYTSLIVALMHHVKDHEVLNWKCLLNNGTVIRGLYLLILLPQQGIHFMNKQTALIGEFCKLCILQRVLVDMR